MQRNPLGLFNPPITTSMLFATPSHMSDFKANEDLYAVVSRCPNPLTVRNSRPVEKQSIVLQPELSRKRIRDDASGFVSQKKPGVNLPELKGTTSTAHHQMRMLRERARREDMNSLFKSLRSLLPAPPIKTDKATILDETMAYIKTLQRILKDLQERKSEMEAYELGHIASVRKAKDPEQASYFHIPLSVAADSDSAVKLFGCTVVGRHAFTTIRGPRESGFVSRILSVLDANQLEVVDYTFNAVECGDTVYALHAVSSKDSQQLTLQALTSTIKDLCAEASHEK